MRRLPLLLILSAIPLSCLDNAEFQSAAASSAVIELGTTAVFFGPEASSGDIKVISADSWKAECLSEWLEITPSDSSINVRASSNDSPDEREGVISVSTREQTSEIRVYQEALSTSVSISRQSVSSKASALSENILLTANYPYTVTIEGNAAEWLSLSLSSPVEGDGKTCYPAGTDIPLTVSAAAPDVSRSATVRFSVPDMSCTLKVSQTLEDLVISVDFESAGTVNQPFTTAIPTSNAGSTDLGTEETPYTLNVGGKEYVFATRCPVKGSTYYIKLASTVEYGTGLFVKGGGTSVTPLTYIKLPAVPGRSLGKAELSYGLVPAADYPLYICTDASSFANVTATTLASVTANANVSGTDIADINYGGTKHAGPYYIVFGSSSRFFLSHLKLTYN